MKTLLLCLTLIFATNGISQTKECICCSGKFTEFQFWAGDWNVFDTLGNQVGENDIRVLEDGCILQENWISKNGGSGSSYNYYNLSDSTWNQVWIDNQGGVLNLKGSFTNGKMVLRSNLKQGTNGPYYDEISWEEKTDGSVVQLWVTRNENGDLIGTLFLGIYRPK